MKHIFDRALTLSELEDFHIFRDDDFTQDSFLPDSEIGFSSNTYFSNFMSMNIPLPLSILTGTNGDDVLTNNSTDGSVTGIDGLAGNDTITNNGMLFGNILGGDGDDAVFNNNDLLGDADLGDGNDSIENDGVVFGNIVGGLGNDVITNNGGVDASIYRKWDRL